MRHTEAVLPRTEHVDMIANETNLVIALKKAMSDLPSGDRAELMLWMNSELTKDGVGTTHIESEAEGTLVGSIKAAFAQLSSGEKRLVMDWTVDTGY